MGQEIDGEVMGEQFKGYIFKITGGNDKQGFQMKQGILINGRTRILYKKRKYFSSLVFVWSVFCSKSQIFNNNFNKVLKTFLL